MGQAVISEASASKALVSGTIASRILAAGMFGVKAGLVFLLLGLHAAVVMADITVVYPRPEISDDERQNYPIELLQLALQQSGKKYQLVASEHTSTQLRALKKMEFGLGIDVVWTMTSNQREALSRPIRIPIDKGMFGWRIPLIRQADAERFDNIASATELQALLAGQGHDWPDVDILRHNQYRVATSPSYIGLFKMLATGRIDYFPRAVIEAWIEQQNHADKDLIVDPNLLMIYPTAFYFFVHKDAEQLAQDIEQGLEVLIANGEFDRLFNRHYGDCLERSRLEQRKVFYLENPLLSDATPLDRKELWLQLEQ